MVATLNQPQYAPWPMEEQVVALYAGIDGYLDEIPAAQVPRFQDELREHLRAEGTVYKAIRDSGDLGEETERSSTPSSTSSRTRSASSDGGGRESWRPSRT